MFCFFFAAVPVFRFQNKPRDVNVTDGDDVTIVCDAYADPPAVVTWFIDGKKIDSRSMDSSMRN